MISLENALLSNLWVSLGLYALVAVLDYILTLRNARVYRASSTDTKLHIKGSYEITPFFQAPVDQLKLFNPRFLLVLGLSAVLLVLVWYWSAAQNAPEVFAVLLGGFVIRSLIANLRHIENAVWYRSLSNLGPQDVFHSEQPRWLYIQSSAVNRLMLAALLLAASLLTGSVFLLGGCFACGGIALQQWRLSRRERRPVQA